MRLTLTATGRELSQLRTDLAIGVHQALELPRQDWLEFRAFKVSGGRETSYQLTCERHGEYAIDNRGAQLPVLEISVGRGWRVLIGVSVTWNEDAHDIHRFVGSQLIMFLDGSGRSDATASRQVMRLEWEALDVADNWSGEIAHPHWQIDLAGFATIGSEDVSSVFAPLGERDLLDRPLLESLSASSASDLTWSSRLHLAASARWMERAWCDERPVPHVCGPQDLIELTAWVTSSCRYLARQVEAAFDA